MKRLFAAIALVVALVLLAGCAAPNTVAAIKARGELVVATNAEFPPFEYFEGQDIVGVDIEIAQAIADKLGVKLKVEHMDFDAVLIAVPSGKADLGIAGLSVDDERKKAMDFSDNYINTSVVMLVAIDNDTIHTIDDLTGKKIGVQLGTIADSVATDDVVDAEVVRMNKDTDSVQDLINGKLDAVLLDINPAQVYAQQNSDKIKLIDTPLREDVYAVALKKGNTELLNTVNEVIKELKDSGKLDEIFEKYGIANK